MLMKTWRRPVIAKLISHAWPSERDLAAFAINDASASLNSGYTLVELMVAVGLGSLTLLVIATIMSWTANMNQNGSDRVQAAKNIADATYQITAALSQAVNVIQPFPPSANLNATSIDASGLGQLRLFSGDSIAGDPSGPVFTIAVFNREAANSAPGVSQSQILPTALYYQMPTPDKSGALYLDLGGDPSNPINLSPSAKAFLIDRVVGFDVLSVQLAPSSQLITSVQLAITVRYFLGEYVPGSGVWCPAQDIGVVPGCVATAPFKDIVSNFQVGLANNLIPSDGTSATQQSSEGQIYFFNLLMPTGFL